MTDEEERLARHTADDDALDDPLNLLADVLRASPRAGEDRQERARQQMAACLAELRTAVTRAQRSLAEYTPPLAPR